MIPYADLVAALRHWRSRNGLPNIGADVSGVDAGGPPPQAPAMTAGGPPPMARTSAPMVTPPSPPKAMAHTIDIEEELDAHDIQSEDLYEAEGNDFAMSFGDTGPPIPDESTALGVPPPAPPGFGPIPGTNPKFPAGGGYTEPGRTDPDKFGGGSDDDFAQEQAPAAARQPPARDGTQPGIGIGDNRPPPKPKKKKKW